MSGFFRHWVGQGSSRSGPCLLSLLGFCAETNCSSRVCRIFSHIRQAKADRSLEIPIPLLQLKGLWGASARAPKASHKAHAPAARVRAGSEDTPQTTTMDGR